MESDLGLRKEGDGTMGETLTEYCTRMGKPELLKQWHRNRNGPLTPDMIAYGSRTKVWWRCDQGHEWQAMVKSRIAGCGCPVCANRKIVPGENDLATTHPELAAQWHPEKNPGETPYQISAGTRRKVWWRCERGHEWQATVNSRAEGAGCPVCANKLILPGENDLASRFPDLAREWDTALNLPLTAESVSPCSNRRVWWRCDLGHTYRAPVSHRTTRKSGCPYCAGKKVLPGFNDLATLEPDIAAQWDTELNAPLTPEQVTVGSHQKVWWRCAEGHVWQAMIYSRTGAKKCGCPVCAGVVKRVPRHRYAVPAERKPSAYI